MRRIIDLPNNYMIDSKETGKSENSEVLKTYEVTYNCMGDANQQIFPHNFTRFISAKGPQEIPLTDKCPQHNLTADRVGYRT